MQDVKIILRDGVSCMITVEHEISFLGKFTLSDARVYPLQYVFDFIRMWSIKFDKSVHLSVCLQLQLQHILLMS